MIAAHSLAQAWTTFYQQAPIKRPETEQEYENLLELMHHITDQMEARGEGVENSLYTPLFELVAMYLHDWEKQYEPQEETSAAKSLHFLIEQHGLTQTQLAAELNISQSHVSKILSGEREIGRQLAQKLARRFGLPVGIFLHTY
jgi:HTH-type transcriptional regulator / antitoxin HigA